MPLHELSSIRSGQRNVALDALRGVAVVGIVLMNVYVFAMPQQAYLNPQAWGGESFLDIAVWAFSFLFIEDKFRTIFAMLFGVGVAMMLTKEASAEGFSRYRKHFQRMAVLFAIGLVHAILLANNDILRGYALAGLLLPFFIPLAKQTLLGVAALLLAAHVSVGIFAMGGVSVYLEQAQQQQSSNQEIVTFARQNYGSDPAALAISMERGKESLSDRIIRRTARIPATTLFVMGSIPLNLAAMLVGVVLWKSGLISGRWPAKRMRKLALRLGLLGLLPLLLLLAIAVHSNFAPVVMGAQGLFFSEPFDLLLGCAYVALAMSLFQRARQDNHLLSHLAAAGRMSLTNYLMTSLILAFLFASWGLGWFGTMDRHQVFLCSLLPISLILLWSRHWLRYFHTGPFERIWRSLASAQLRGRR